MQGSLRAGSGGTASMQGDGVDDLMSGCAGEHEESQEEAS